MTAPAPLLEIKELKVVFRGEQATHAVDSVDLELVRGATLGLVGESGCGKSVTALAVMGLLPAAAAEISGSVRFEGIDLFGLPSADMRDLRGDRVAMIFQAPVKSPNSRYTS